jgi:WD domain, G-beta repeat
MRLHHQEAKRISCSTSLAIAWIMSSCPGYADEIALESDPSPVIVRSGRMLLRTSVPASSPIGESVAFSPDGKALAAGRLELSYDKDGKNLSSSTVVSIFNAIDGTLSARIDLANTTGCSVAYSPDGMTLAIGLAQEVKLYDAWTNRERASLKADRSGVFEKLAIAADGRRLASVSYDSIVIWDLASTEPVATFKPGTGPVHSVAFSPDGKMLVSASEGVSTDRPMGPAGQNGSLQRPAGGEIHFWHLDGKPARQSFECLRPAFDVAFSPDGRSLAAASSDGARIWDLAGGEHRKIAAAPVYCVAYSSDGRYLALGTEHTSDDGAAGEVRLWDKETGRDRFVFQGQMSRVCSVAFAPNGRTLAAASREGVFLWDFAIPAPKGETIAASPSGARRDGRQTDPRQAGRAKKSNRWTRTDEFVFWLMISMMLLAVPLMIVLELRAFLLLYKARPECVSLIKCWVEQDGMSLLHCRMFLNPLVYRVSVENRRGIECRGWVHVTGRFATTPEFIPLEVHYFCVWPVARHANASSTRASTSLWDDWLDRCAGS